MFRYVPGAFLALLLPIEAFACSPVREYRVPTNIELLDTAQLVVLATVNEGPERCEGDGRRRYCFSSIALSPMLELKGEAPEELTVEGTLTGRDGAAAEPAFTGLDRPHPSSLWGACIRQAYAEGTTVLAMFDLRDGQWSQLQYPFARAVEDVEGPDALWVRAAQLYLSILRSTPRDELADAFATERERQLALTGDAGAQAIADDIARYLAAVRAEGDGG